jgi:hypothetical protein
MNPPTNIDGWMPVFVVVPGMCTVTASADDPDSRPTESSLPDYLQRVGTATIHPGGEIAIELFAVPLGGRLVLRKPQPGDLRFPWKGQ